MYNDYNEDCANCVRKYPEVWQDPRIEFDTAPAEMYGFCSTMEHQLKDTIAYSFNSLVKDLEDWNTSPTSTYDPKAPILVKPGPRTIKARRLQLLTAEENQILITTTEHSPKPVIKKFIEILQTLYDGGCFDKEEIPSFNYPTTYNPYPTTQPQYPSWNIPFGRAAQPTTPVTDNKETTSVKLFESVEQGEEEVKDKIRSSFATLDQIYESLSDDKESDNK